MSTPSMTTVGSLHIPTRTLNKAIRLAAQEPRVSAIIQARDGQFVAVPGYMDSNSDVARQVLLFTPDGRAWTEAAIVRKPR